MPSLSPAGSPPAPSPAALPNSRKRPSMSAQTGPGLKRRKPSTYSASGSAHPLRQTSFPPEESAISAGIRSPSAETDITQSAAASTTGKRGRKRKSNAADTTSVRSGPSAKGTSSRGGQGETAAAAAQEENEAGEDEDEEEPDDAEVDGAGRAMEEEKARYAALYEAADAEQQDRLTNFRRFHLNEGRVRRIVNQTLSQSVPKSVIVAVNSYTKYFIASLIERSIEIQRHDALGAIGELVQPMPEEEEEEEDDDEEAQNPDGMAIDSDQKGAKPAKDSDKGKANADARPANGTEAPAASGTPNSASTLIPAKTNGDSNSPATSAKPSPVINTNVATVKQSSSTPSSPAPSGPPDGVIGAGESQEVINKREHAKGKEVTIGPLRPDYIREALRRMKKEGDFGGVGMEGVSTGLGMPGSRASAMGGRRLFR